MVNGKPGEWYQDDYIGGYFNKNGELVVCEEYGLTDADIDKYAVEVQNGDGYYDDEGRLRRYGRNGISKERFENAPDFDEKLYYVEIKETLSRIIPVKAFSQQEASEEIEGKYDRGEIVLDASDHIDTEFKTIDEANVTVTVKSKEQEGVKSKDDGREIE